jgi:hypothetical protein
LNFDILRVLFKHILPKKGEILSFDGIFGESRNKTAQTTNLMHSLLPICGKFTRALLAHQIFYFSFLWFVFGKRGSKNFKVSVLQCGLSRFQVSRFKKSGFFGFQDQIYRVQIFQGS